MAAATDRESAERPKPLGRWEKADIGAKILISLTALSVTWYAGNAAQAREANEKMMDVAIRILESPETRETATLRPWALKVFQKAANVSWEDLSPEAATALAKGGQLPPPETWVLPNPQQLRIRILFPGQATGNHAFQIRDSLVAGGYADTEVRPENGSFPDSTEVRFYYAADSANAWALNQYLQHLLPTKSRPNDSSGRARGHVQGELHVYVKQ